MQNLAKQTLALQALAIVLAPTLICAQTLPPESSGTLDASFGTGGKVTTDFAGSFDGASSVAVQPDGNIVVAGATYINGGSDFALARYDSNGTLDASFGIGGQVITDFAGSWDGASSVAVQGDGKIVAAGFAGITPFSNFALARYNSDGTLDTSFGTRGKVTTEFACSTASICGNAGVSARAYSVAVQSDGRIVVTGYANIDGGYDFALARYKSDGTLDASFGTGGTVITDFGLLEQGFSFAHAFSLAVQADGKIVAAGQAYIGTGFDVALARYESDGALDASFGTGGKVTTDFGGFNDWMSSVAVQPDGKIVVAGQANIVRGYSFALARYESNGALDTSFGTAGKVTTDFGLLDQGFSVAQASSLAVQLDGKIVAGGRAFINGDFHSALARYDSFGTLDAGFGTSGKVTIIFGGSGDGVSSVAVQPDGKIVVAGGAVINEFGDFALARLN